MHEIFTVALIVAVAATGGMALVLSVALKKAHLRDRDSAKAAGESEVLCSRLKEDLEREKAERRRTEENLRAAEIKVSALEERNAGLVKLVEERKAAEEELRKKIEADFKNFSSEMFDGAREKITSANKEQLSLILNPLRENLKNFSEKIENLNISGEKGMAALGEQIRTLWDMSAKVGKEAENLANALKGDNKALGNWGECVLKRLLEDCGLAEGRDFLSQATFKSEEEFGTKLLRPDIVVNLPDSKTLVIDSKVSLLDYENYCSSEKPEEKKKSFEKFTDSIKRHINGLSEKHYEKIPKLKNPEFVLMFMPVESAYALLVSRDSSILDYAYFRKIVIVTPSTLLGILKIVENLWRVEKQTKNAEDIAELGGKLHDSVVRFIEDFLDVGRRLDMLNRDYEKAKKSLSSGNGNVVRCAVRLRELGAKTKGRLKIEDESKLLEE